MTLPPFPESNIYMSAEYLKGYQEGFEDAKAMIADTLKRMQALCDSTSTITVESL